MFKRCTAALLTVSWAAALFGQSPTDADIQAALSRGQATPGKRLWAEIKKKQQFRLNRAGMGDPIEKKILVLTDLDRIALESAAAKRQLREISIGDVKQHLPFGIIEILLEANCYNNLYANSLSKWGPSGGVHLVLKVGAKVIQPIDKTAGQFDSVAILPQEHGVLSRQGSQTTYTPLYQTAFYERASQRAWFAFPAQLPTVRTFTVTAISSEGKQKEKEIENPAK